MPLSDDDYRDILQYTRGALRDRGLAALEERLTFELRTSVRNRFELGDRESPYIELREYLRMMLHEFSLSSNEQFRAVITRFREFSRVSDGAMVEGIKLRLTSEDAALFDIREIDLSGNPSLQEIIDDLRLLLFELERDREEPQNPAFRGE